MDDVEAVVGELGQIVAIPRDKFEIWDGRSGESFSCFFDDTSRVVDSSCTALGRELCKIGRDNTWAAPNVEDIGVGFDVWEEVFTGCERSSFPIELGDGWVVSIDEPALICHRVCESKVLVVLLRFK